MTTQVRTPLQETRNVTFLQLSSGIPTSRLNIKGNRRYNRDTKSRCAQEYSGLYRRAFFARAL